MIRPYLLLHLNTTDEDSTILCQQFDNVEVHGYEKVQEILLELRTWKIFWPCRMSLTWNNLDLNNTVIWYETLANSTKIFLQVEQGWCFTIIQLYTCTHMYTRVRLSHMFSGKMHTNYKNITCIDTLQWYMYVLCFPLGVQHYQYQLQSPFSTCTGIIWYGYITGKCAFFHNGFYTSPVLINYTIFTSTLNIPF